MILSRQVTQVLSDYPISDTPLSGLKSASQTSILPNATMIMQNLLAGEEGDETSSETANEPVTPVDVHPESAFQKSSLDLLQNNGAQISRDSPLATPPLILHTVTVQPSRPLSGKETTISIINDTQISPQTNSISSRADPNVKRVISQFFRRSNSHISNVAPMSTSSCGGSETMLSSNQRSSIRRMSATPSPNTTRSNTPPSPGSPSISTQQQTSKQDPAPGQFLSNTKNLSSAAQGIRKKFITFPQKPKKEHESRKPSKSIDLETGLQISNSQRPELTRHPWAIPAETGAGLKARRMSLSLPDDFTVEVVELHKEFADQSKMFGRRGKTLGKGATSTVTLMTRKGGSSELYAVKEFRGKNSGEKEEDYEKKVKSEFSIAKSLHHPNIVETVRLCTNRGKWNHVMEYCQEGDLFNLVQKGYLKKGDRLSDRLCLFKQLIQGVNYLHEHGIAHRDIKLENLLITQQSTLKITDFGVSEVFCGIHPGLRAAGGQCGREMNEIRLCTPGICGSMPYIAPEVVLKQGEYDPRPLDVWSSAIVMLHIIFGGALWPRAEAGHTNYDSLQKGWDKWNAKHPEGGKIIDGDYPHIAAFDTMINPPALRRLLIGMLNPNPATRYTIGEVAKNRWMKNVECCQVETYDDPSQVIDASKSRTSSTPSRQKVVHHNHLPPAVHKGHSLVRLPGSTEM